MSGQTPRLPKTEAQVQLNENHFLASWRDAAALGGCRYTVRAPDAVFIPPAWPHAVASVAPSRGGVAQGASTRPGQADVVAAVNFFYE